MPNGDSTVENPQEPTLEERLRAAVERLQSRGGVEAQRASIPPLPRERFAQEERLREKRQELGQLVDLLGATVERGSELILGMSPVTGYKELFEIAQRTDISEVGEVVQNLASANFEEANAQLFRILGRSPTAQRQAALQTAAVGGLVSGLGEAIANVLELPAEVANVLPEDFAESTSLDDMANGILFATSRSKDSIRQFSAQLDQEAIALGASPEDVVGAKVVGGLVGFTAPLFGALKVASLLPFAQGAGFRPFFLRDLTAGAILGGTITEGDLKERITHASSEAAFFGAWSLALGGLGFSLKAFRTRRLLQKLEDDAVGRLVRQVEEAYNPETGRLDLRRLDGETGRAVFQVLSEEQAIAESRRAGRVLVRTADEESLVHAILDQVDGATTGVVRGVKNPDDVAAMLQERIPGLATQVAKRERASDVLFAIGEDLPEELVKRFTSEGRFPGQRLLVAGQEMEYVGRGPTAGRVKVRRIDSQKELNVSEEVVQDLPFGTSTTRPSKELKELVDGFVDQFQRRYEQVLKNRSDLSQEQLQQAAREGTLAELGVSGTSRRDFPVNNAFGLPEEAGVRSPELPPEVLAKMLSDGTAHLKQPVEPVTFRQMVRQFAEERQLISEVPEGTAIPALREQIQNEELVLDALTSEAAKRIRQLQWQNIPQKERRLLEELRDQVIRTLEDTGPSLKRDAALSGFNVKRLPGGRLELREVNTGLGATFDTESAAREALRGVERRLGDDVGRSLFPRFSDETPFTSHLPPADDFMLTGREPAGEVVGMLTERPRWINLNRWAQEFEELTGLPAWTHIFEPLDVAQRAKVQDLEPWAKRIMGIWKGMSRKERAALDPFWQEIAGKRLSNTEMLRIADDLGLSAKQKRAALASLEVERALFRETDLPDFRYLENHFARIRPQIEEQGRLPRDVSRIIGEDLPQEAKAFWQKARTGELAQREVDPLLVQLKYVRSVLWDKHLRGAWERARAFVGPRSNPFNIGDLPTNQATRLIETFGGDMEGVRKAHGVLEEYLGRARGFPSEGERTATRIMKRVVDKLDLDISGEVLEEAVNIGMTFMYGAAMAGRPRMVARNLSQNLWFSWMRLDGDVIGPALANTSRNRSVWREALGVGAVRPQQRGVFAGEAAFEGHLANLPETGEIQRASNAVARRLFALGEAGRKTSSIGMIPFGSADDFNRVWAYDAQKRHTLKYLNQMKRGEITEAKFLEEGLRGHSPTTKREFARRFDLLGESEALQFIGKKHADEAHFIYARMAQPPWLQGDVGKFAGMFGTYSLWSKDYMMTLARNMTFSQRAQMVAKGAATASGLYLVAEEMGFDLNNWMSPLAAFTFTGGPGVEMVDIGREVIANVTWNPARSAGAAQRLGQEVLDLSYPGRGLQRDLMQAGEMTGDIGMQTLSLILARPEHSEGNFFMEVMLPHEDGIFTPFDQVEELLSPPER